MLKIYKYLAVLINVRGSDCQKILKYIVFDHFSTSREIGKALRTQEFLQRNITPKSVIKRGSVLQPYRIEL